MGDVTQWSCPLPLLLPSPVTRVLKSSQQYWVGVVLPTMGRGGLSSSGFVGHSHPLLTSCPSCDPLHRHGLAPGLPLHRSCHAHCS